MHAAFAQRHVKVLHCPAFLQTPNIDPCPRSSRHIDIRQSPADPRVAPLEMGASNRALATTPSEDPHDRAAEKSEPFQVSTLFVDVLHGASRTPPPNGMDRKCRRHPVTPELRFEQPEPSTAAYGGYRGTHTRPRPPGRKAFERGPRELISRGYAPGTRSLHANDARCQQSYQITSYRQHSPRQLSVGGSAEVDEETDFIPHSPDNALSFGAACAIQI